MGSKFFAKTEVKIFLICFLVYLLFLSPYPQSLAKNLLDSATSIVDHHNFILDQWHGMDTSFKDGFYYSGYPPGASILAALGYIVFKPIISLFPKNLELIILNIICIIFISAPLAALTAVVFYKFIQFFLKSRRNLLLVTFLFAFGTMNFSYAAGYFKKTIVTFCLFLAFYLLFRAKLNKRILPSVLIGVGFLCGYSILTDYPSIFIAFILLLYFLSFHRLKKVIYLILGGILPIAFLLFYQYKVFGSIWLTSYDFNLAIAPSGNQLGLPNPLNTFSLLFGLEDGFFIYTPIAIFSILGIYKSLKERRFVAETITILSILIVVPALFSGWVPEDPVASHPSDISLPARYLLSLTPFIMIPICFVIKVVRRKILLGFGILSIFFSYLAAQTGFIPSHVIPVVYASKVFITSFGMGAFFSDFLPKVFGIQTLHSYVCRPEITFSDLIYHTDRALQIRLLGGQLLFFALNLMAALVIGYLIWRIIKYRGISR